MPMTMRSRTRLVVLLLYITLCVASVIVPFMLWYPPDLKYQVMGDLEVLGFSTHGQMWVESAVGKQLHLLEFDSNVSIPVGDCRIDSLVVMQGKEKDSYWYDTVLFNSTGKMDIEAINITLLKYEVQDRADDITLTFWNEEVNTYVSILDPTTLTFRFESNTSDAIYVCMPEGSRQGLIIDLMFTHGFGGVLKISGDQNFTLPLYTGERAGIALTVSVPRNNQYVMQATGSIRQVNLNNFSAATYYFQDGLGASNLGALFPRGKFAYGEKSMELTGSQDLNLTDFSGKVSLMHTSYFDLMRMVIDGTTSSFMIGSSGRHQLVSPRTASDLLFPSPFPFSWIGIAGIATIVIWYYKPSRKDVIVLSFVYVFLFGLLGWSIYHERPQWIQSTLAFATLVCTAIQILLLIPRTRKSGSNPRDPTTNTERDKLEDKLIDFMVAFEALFFKEGEFGEFRHKLSVRVSRFLEQEYERRKLTARKMNDFYEKRSKIVHVEKVKLKGDFVKIVEDHLRKSIKLFLERLPTSSHDEIIAHLDLD